MRAANRLLGLVAALALAGLGVVVAIETILLATGRDPWLIPRDRWNANLPAVRWEDGWVTATCIVLAGVGAVLLVAELLPKPPLRLAVGNTVEGREVSMSRRGLEGQLTRLADRDPEVLAPTVKVTRRAAKLRAGFPTHADPSSVGARLRTMVTERLDAVHLEQPLRVEVRLRPARRRVS